MTRFSFLLSFLALLFLSSLAHSGGIIQEFRTTKDDLSQSSHALTSSTPSAPPLGPQYTAEQPNPTRSPHTQPCQKPTVIVIYNDKTHSTQLSWTASVFQDQAPLRYLIYRRHINETDWTLIATVSGQTLTFSDAFVPGPSHLYVYRIEAIHQVAGRTFSVGYLQADLPKPSLEAYQPPVGLACSAAPLSSLPSSFLLFFLLALPLFLRRRRG